MKTVSTEIKWSFFFILMMLLWMLMEKLSGLHGEHIDKHIIVTNFVAIPAIAMYVFAFIDKRKRDYDNKMTYKQGLRTGFIMTGIITVFSPLTQYITSVYISPEYFANAIEYSVSENMMSRSDAEAFFNMKSYLIQTVIGTPIMGIVTTLIVAIFTRKK